jgi:enoyl-CoA hydratase
MGKKNKYETILYEKKGKIVTLTLNRPDKLNAMSVKMRREMVEAIENVNRDDDVLVAIIKGAGKAFSAGHDLTEVYFRYGAGVGKPGERRPSQRGRLHGDDELMGEYLKCVMYCWKVTIAQIHGQCIAGANYLQLMCDISIASEDAQFAFTEQRLAFGGTTPVLLPHMMATGWRRARYVLLTGQTFSGKEAEQMGFVSLSVPVDKLEEEVRKIAEAVCLHGRDAIAIGKAHTHMVYDRLGFGDCFKQGVIMHAMATNVRWEQDEYNFVRERRERGAKEAFHELHDRFRRLGIK